MMAVFMIVTLAAIGLYLLTVSAVQAEATSQDEQGARAYQAARTGIEWGAFQLLRNGSCPATQLLTLQQGFFATVTCVTVGVENEGAISVNVHLITATGCNRTACGPTNTGATYVERQLELTLTREL